MSARGCRGAALPAQALQVDEDRIEEMGTCLLGGLLRGCCCPQRCFPAIAVTGTASAWHAAVSSGDRTAAINTAPWITDGLLTGTAETLTGHSAFRTARPARADPRPSSGRAREHRAGEQARGRRADAVPLQPGDEASRTPRSRTSSPARSPTCPSTRTRRTSRRGLSRAAVEAVSSPSTSPARSEDPRQLAFVPALPGTYHGEGMHAITVNTASFRGDVLAVNNEPCGANGVGGFDLRRHEPRGAGSSSRAWAISRPTTRVRRRANPAAVPNAHSIFIWQDSAKAYAVIIDNTELHDVDIFDITNPRAPVFIGDHDLDELAKGPGPRHHRQLGQRQHGLQPRHGRQGDQRRR